jgi:DNA primase
MPEGMDPDNVVRDRGRDAFLQLVEAAAPILEWELTRILARAEGQGQREKMEALREAVAALAKVPAGVEREYYVTWLAQKAAADSPSHLQSLESAVREELSRRAPRRGGAGRRTEDTPPPRPPAEKPKPTRAPAGRISTSLLAACLEHGEISAPFVGMLQKDDFLDPQHQAIFDAIVGLVERGESVTAQAVLAQVEPEARGLLAEIALEQVPHERVEEFLKSAVRRLVEARLRRRQRQLQEQLVAADSKDSEQAIRQELSEVARQRSALAAERIVGPG